MKWRRPTLTSRLADARLTAHVTGHETHIQFANIGSKGTGANSG
jgi:hypothetical protein